MRVDMPGALHGVRPVIRHIPDELRTAREHGTMQASLGYFRTYCGRWMPHDRCINRRRDCIEDAECKACQRSDDRRVADAYQAEQLAGTFRPR